MAIETSFFSRFFEGFRFLPRKRIRSQLSSEEKVHLGGSIFGDPDETSDGPHPGDEAVKIVGAAIQQQEDETLNKKFGPRPVHGEENSA